VALKEQSFNNQDSLSRNYKMKYPLRMLKLSLLGDKQTGALVKIMGDRRWIAGF
jgi:hypothetical protein